MGVLLSKCFRFAFLFLPKSRSDVPNVACEKNQKEDGGSAQNAPLKHIGGYSRSDQPVPTSL